MAQMLRKHWKWALVHLVILAIAAGVLVQQLLLRPVRAADSVTGGGATTVPTTGPVCIEPILYGHVVKVRQELCLTDRDLAAMGCSAEQTTAILKGLLAWCTANQAALAEAEQADRNARRNLQLAVRRVNVGPRDDALLGQVPALKEQITAVQQQRQRLVAGAAEQVSMRLGSSQSPVWAAARANALLPGHYRYVPDLTADQWRVLEPALGRLGDNTAAVAAVEERTMAVAQRTAMQSAASNMKLGMLQVVKVTQQVLPAPGELEFYYQKGVLKRPPKPVTQPAKG